MAERRLHAANQDELQQAVLRDLLASGLSNVEHSRTSAGILRRLRANKSHAGLSSASPSPFWGRKGQWREHLFHEHPYPAFNQFLKAGYCRVVVPARLGFEGAIDHYLKIGDIWNGGPLPTVSSGMYLSIADEIAEGLDHPGDEVPQGDPWLVRIPTTLVRLRADNALPSWGQASSGNWVEI